MDILYKRIKNRFNFDLKIFSKKTKYSYEIVEASYEKQKEFVLCGFIINVAKNNRLYSSIPYFILPEEGLYYTQKVDEVSLELSGLISLKDINKYEKHEIDLTFAFNLKLKHILEDNGNIYNNSFIANTNPNNRPIFGIFCNNELNILKGFEIISFFDILSERWNNLDWVNECDLNFVSTFIKFSKNTFITELIEKQNIFLKFNSFRPSSLEFLHYESIQGFSIKVLKENLKCLKQAEVSSITNYLREVINPEGKTEYIFMNVILEEEQYTELKEFNSFLYPITEGEITYSISMSETSEYNFYFENLEI